MIVHQVFALIFDETVQNVIVCDNYEMANFLSRAAYGNDGFAVDCLQYACQIGDKYINNIFYHYDSETQELTEIPYTPTEEQEVAMLKINNEIADESNLDLDYRLTCLELGI